MKGKLYVCATPIGNMEDVSYRLVRILGEVDLVAAEDTRRTRKLLTHYGVQARLSAYHDANERKQTSYLTDKMAKGTRVALVTDGGMPGVSDPGFRLIRACIDSGIDVEVIPGPSAVLTALVLSGLPTARFCFEGFLPKAATAKSRRLGDLADEERTMVFFESPRRASETLTAMREAWGNRFAAVARELTKMHEEVVRGTIDSVLEQLETPLLGEVVLVVSGREARPGGLDAAIAYAQDLERGGTRKSQAAATAAARFDAPRRSVYDGLLEQSPNPGDPG
ncbi:MAG: 16S rRNA (cytidine(1402)-2'-O)-methyltransferase [Actinobacteria bacterium]|nr:16S rRNA (cytidine(1402)-2'-O)-methyltransferase [Actinomycetota bacterium]